MSRYRFTFPQDINRLLWQAKELNARRTPGGWTGHENGSVTVDGEALSFPVGDPDTEFLAFITEHFGDIIAAIEERYVLCPITTP